MFDKIIIGTANFIKPYGILAPDIPLDVQNILRVASEKGIQNLDTAYGYGPILDVVPSDLMTCFQIVTKFSVLDDLNSVLEKILLHKKHPYFPGYKGVLIHDPQNIPLINQHKLKDFFDCLRLDGGIQKIGVSIYDQSDLDFFTDICIPDVVQIPLNPFNQFFNNPHFKSFVKDHGIEVQGRSLFLQGVLLADDLPDMLMPLRPFFLDFQRSIAHAPSRLYAILDWAFQFEWVCGWVLGIGSIAHLQEIIETSLTIHSNTSNQTKINFQPVNHPLVDPRNWR